jgi:hypothetical protein
MGTKDPSTRGHRSGGVGANTSIIRNIRSAASHAKERFARMGRSLPQGSRGTLQLAPVLAILGLTALTILVFRGQLFDHWTFPWDFVGAYTTTPAFVAASVSTGHLLSWSPFVASGFPVDVDTQSGIYFPGWWLLGGLGISATLRVLTAVQIAHVLFGSVGVLMLARARRLAWSWATLAAVAYLLFGGFYGEAEHADIVRGFAYLPWLLWALTPPQGSERWTRLLCVPPLAWLIATGGYPGQLPPFAIMGLVYLAVALMTGGRDLWRRYRGPLILVALASAATCLAVLLPYLRADQAHELYRILEPTAAVRAGASLRPLDVLGLYLSNFAWTYDGTVTSWAVGIPVLIGIACVRWQTLRRHAPLVACGVVALLLATTPRIGFVGRAMASLQDLFPSRFPAAEYKAGVAIALVVLAAESWSQITTHHRGLAWRAVLIGALLIIGTLLAPSTYAQPTRALWLVLLVIVACVVLVLVRVPQRVLVGVLVALVVVDGVREAYDYRFLGSISPWRASPAEAAPYRARDAYVHKLPTLLKQPGPTTRPGRAPPTAPLSSAPTGSDPDATGWIGEGYHLVDYGSTIELALWQVEHSPQLLKLMLEPWSGFTFPCANVGCQSGGVRLPPAGKWQASATVHTLSYGAERIRYAVDVTQSVLLVENELAIKGWHTNSPHVRSVDAGIPLRAWRLSPGSYTFTASFHELDRTPQELAAIVAIMLWIAAVIALWRNSLWPVRRNRASTQAG